MQNFDLNYLKYLIPNKQAFYDILTESKGFYLPDFDSKAITEEYLVLVAKKEAFTIEREKIKIGILRKKAPKTELIVNLQNQTNKPLGFSEDNPPNKSWLINCLYSLNPNHALFALPEPIVTRELPAE